MSEHQHVDDPIKPLVSIVNVNSPAEKILLKCDASRNERKRNETKEELEKIQERISYSIDQYEYSSKRALELLEESAAANGTVHIEVIDDPSQLYELLADTKYRAQYKQKFAVFIIGYEQKCENREKLLTQVEDFFMETKASNIAKLAADKVSLEEINFDDTMATISVALETTSGALAKLQKLQQDISQVFSVYAAFPNDKKGRKKLEKALLKAQEDCNNLNTTVAKVQRELDEMKERSKKLQRQLEAKSSEVTKLHKSKDESKSLKVTNELLQQEIKEANGLLLKAREENDELRQSQTSAVSVSVSPEYLKLKGELESQRVLNEQLSNEHQVKQAALHSEIEAIKENYEAEIKEMRDKFEEQMKSLMDLDDVEFDEPQTASSKESLLGDMTCDEQTINEEDIVTIDDQKDIVVINDQQDNVLVNDQQDIVVVDNQKVVDEQVLTKTHEQTPTTPLKEVVQHEVAAQLQDDWGKAEAKQRKLEEELKEVKSKLKKLATSLKAQIADQQSKHEAAMHDQEIEMKKVKSQLDALDQERQQERSKFDDIVAEKDKIEHELSQAISTNHGQSQIIDDLHSQLEEVLQQQAVEDNTHPNTMSRSVQWETPLHTGTTTPLVKSFVNTPLSSRGNTPLPSRGNTPLPSPLPSLPMSKMTNCTLVHDQECTPELQSDSASTPTIVSMQEVPLDDDKLSKTSRSRRQSTSSQAVLTRLEENQESETLSTSDVSTVLCSPNPLATRRLSHELPPAMTMDNPVAKECVKAYKSVMRFKNRIVELISNIGSPQSVAELDTIQELADDSTGVESVHTQVTLMRYNLTLALNKIEQVLIEEMKISPIQDATQLAGTTVEENESHIVENDGLAKLKVELRNVKHVMKMESQQHHKVLQDIETANEILKAEIAYLKRKAVENQQEGSELIMFTRLDSDRNSQSLKSALQSNKISNDVYSQTVKTMEEYTSISSDQFVNLAKQYKHCIVVNQIMTDLEGIPVSKKEIIKERVAQFSQMKSRHLSAELDELRTKRTHLADTLTVTLGKIENDTDVFLIKPIVQSSKRNWLEPSLRLPSKPAATSFRYHPSRKARQSDVCSHTILHPKLQQVSSTADNRSSTLMEYLQSQHRRRMHVAAPGPIIVSGSGPPTRRPRLVKVEKKWTIADSVVVKPSSKPHHDVDSTTLPPINIPIDVIV